MFGNYVHVVASGVPTKEFSFCSAGVFGVHFIRENPLASTFEVIAGTIVVFKIDHIKSKYPYVSDLAITLRQQSSAATQLPFVTFAREDTYSEVIVDATELL